MDDEKLIWRTNEVKPLLHTPVFDVVQQSEVSATGLEFDYVAMNAPDWVVVVPVYRGNFVLVRQWRHGEDRLTTELPGGVMNPGEDPAETARRELLEETGFRAGKLTFLGTCSPNPALFKNHFHCFLAEELEPTGEQDLDEDELLNYCLRPIGEVVAEYGSEEYTHAFMGTALAFWFRHIGTVPKN
ncbi:MAG: NUDIX hydrolase [Clostridia bacterium]|nr:NUDIX hydrolase [Clostridia bacterium]